MSDIVTRLWRLFYVIAFQCARLVFRFIRPDIRGATVAIWHDGRVLLVRSSYRRGWTLPGGLVKKGEALAEAAVRETFEEVGIRLKSEDLRQVGKAPGDLGPRDRSHLFEVNLESPVEITVDGREIIHAEFVSPEEALNHNLHANVRSYLLTHKQ